MIDKFLGLQVYLNLEVDAQNNRSLFGFSQPDNVIFEWVGGCVTVRIWIRVQFGQ